MNTIGHEMYCLMEELYPICRSITGDGVRNTLKILKKHIPIFTNEVPTGTQVYDWTIPKEWNINDAYIRNSKGERVVDFKGCNLHVVNYSVPLRKKMGIRELREHLFTIPEHPDWIPYRTSYYEENWGFCLTHDQFLKLEDEEFEVVIDSFLEDGSLTYGEYFLEGEIDDEVLISCHICHPSLCNDNLSGMVLSTFLAKYLRDSPRRYSYRFLFVPGTIGSITWLFLNEPHVAKIKHGLVLACVGDSGGFTYKKSRQGDTEIDRAVPHVLKESGRRHRIIDFVPYGYDERQFCSPGFNLPVGCFMRTPHSQYPEYHTSADNLDLIKPHSLAESLAICLDVLYVLENNKTYLNLNPKGEPQLGKRNLYEKIDGNNNSKKRQLAMLWVLNLCDGKHTLLDIAERSRLEFSLIKEVASILRKNNLLDVVI